MKAQGNVLILKPVDQSQLEKPKDSGFGAKKETASNTIEWRVVSVGDGFFLGMNPPMHVALPFSLGDVVILRASDEHLRERWVTTNFKFNGEKAIYAPAIDSVHSESLVLVLVSRNGVDVNDNQIK